MSRRGAGAHYSQRKGAEAPPTNSCKFIVGEKPYGPSPWCDKPVDGEGSYCPEHRAICYVPLDPQAARNFNRSAEFVGKMSR